jgi:hypothetical protein
MIIKEIGYTCMDYTGSGLDLLEGSGEQRKESFGSVGGRGSIYLLAER